MSTENVGNASPAGSSGHVPKYESTVEHNGKSRIWTSIQTKAPKFAGVLSFLGKVAGAVWNWKAHLGSGVSHIRDKWSKAPSPLENRVSTGTSRLPSSGRQTTNKTAKAATMYTGTRIQRATQNVLEEHKIENLIVNPAKNVRFEISQQKMQVIVPEGNQENVFTLSEGDSGKLLKRMMNGSGSDEQKKAFLNMHFTGTSSPKTTHEYTLDEINAALTFGDPAEGGVQFQDCKVPLDITQVAKANVERKHKSAYAEENISFKDDTINTPRDLRLALQFGQLEIKTKGREGSAKISSISIRFKKKKFPTTYNISPTATKASIVGAFDKIVQSILKNEPGIDDESAKSKALGEMGLTPNIFDLIKNMDTGS